MSEERMNRDLKAVEAALSSLTPTPSGVKRDRLMYLAGRAAAEERSATGGRLPVSWLWPCATAASVLVAVAFAAMWFAGGKPEVRIVYRDLPVRVPEQPQQPTVPTDENVEPASPRKQWRTDYLRLRHLVMTEGIDAAIPQSGSAPGADSEVLRWRSGLDRTLEELLEG